MFPPICCLCGFNDEQLALVARLAVLFTTTEGNQEKRDYLWRIVIECHLLQAKREMEAIKRKRAVEETRVRCTQTECCIAG
jgi:hypothetical protein